MNRHNNILAVETSMSTCSVAILEGDKPVADFTSNNKLTHSQKLLPVIDMAFKEWGGSPADIDLFAVSKGPGSFTGLRIGIATIMGFCYGLNKPIVGVSTLEALCYNTPFFNGLLAPIIDSRRESVYGAIYRFENSANDGGIVLKNLCPPEALELTCFIERLEQWGQDVLFLGDGAVKYDYILSGRQIAPPNLCWPSACSLALAARNKEPQKPQQFKADYVRPYMVLNR